MIYNLSDGIIAPKGLREGLSSNEDVVNMESVIVNKYYTHTSGGQHLVASGGKNSKTKEKQQHVLIAILSSRSNLLTNMVSRNLKFS